MENLRKKWEMLGMLSNIPEENRDKAAENLEDMTKYIEFIEGKIVYPPIINVIIFPIMVKIMSTKQVYDFDCENFFKQVMGGWNKYIGTFSYKEMLKTGIDCEAEFCNRFSSQYSIND